MSHPMLDMRTEATGPLWALPAAPGDSACGDDHAHRPHHLQAASRSPLPGRRIRNARGF